MNGKKGKKKKIIGIIVAVVVVLLVVILINTLGSVAVKVAEPLVQVQAYEKHDLSDKVNVTGTVESSKVFVVSTDLTCKVKELKVSLGDYVQEGDVLCVLDDTQIRERIGELEAQASESEKLAAKQKEINGRTLTQAQESRTREVNHAQDVVNQLQSEYDTAVNQYNAVKGTGGEVEEQAYTAMKTLENSLSEAKNNLETVKRTADDAVQAAQDTMEISAISENGSSEVAKSLSELYRQLEEMNVTAGQSGIITMLNISEGSIANGILMQIEDNTNLKIKVNIKERDILKLKEGLKATITSDALRDKTYEGEVIRVINFSASKSGDALPNMMEQGGYSADISIKGDSDLLLGMSARVSIIIQETGEALSVAYDSIVKEDEGAWLYKAVAAEDGKYTVQKVMVTLGNENDYYTEVTSDQLTEGDLIVSYPDMVSEGDKINILQR